MVGPDRRADAVLFVRGATLVRVASQADLEAAIIEHPDAVAPYLAYARWLDAAGDPRGELIAVQAAQLTARGVDFARLKAREDELLTLHADAFYGPRIARSGNWRGWIDWFCGFFQTIAPGRCESKDLAHPSSLFLRHTDAPLPGPHPVLTSWRGHLRADDVRFLAGSPRLERLQTSGTLANVPAETLANVRMLSADADRDGDAAALTRLERSAVPRLSHLGFTFVRGESVANVVATIERVAPAEVGLELSTIGGLGPGFAPIARIAPRVTHLALEWFTGARERFALSDLSFPAVEWLGMSSGVEPEKDAFERLPSMPALRCLRLGSSDEKPRYLAYVAGLRRCALAPQLTAIDLDERQADALAAVLAAPLTALEHLHVRGWLGPGDPPRFWRAVIENASLPALRRLTIEARGQVAGIAGSALATQIEHLTLPIKDDDCARALIEARPQFPRLRTIDITGDRVLSLPMLEALFTMDVEVRWGRVRNPVPGRW